MTKEQYLAMKHIEGEMKQGKNVKKLTQKEAVKYLKSL
jgi:hypothetical protein